MTTSIALMLTVLLSPVLSMAIWLLLASPLRSNLDSASDASNTIKFWVVFAGIMLFIAPLLTGLIIGVGSIPHAGVYPAAGMTRVLASILAGIFVALAGIGTQLAKYSRTMANTRAVYSHRVRGDFE